MKITADPLAYAAKPPVNLRAALVYGPNRALVDAVIAALRTARLPADSNDFSSVTITPDMLKRNPDALAEEMSGFGFFATKKIITIADAGDGITKTVAEALAGPDAGHFLIVDGGALASRSTLRAWAEKGSDVAALACYNLEGAALGKFIAAQFKVQHVAIQTDAVTAIAFRLGDDLTPLPPLVAQLIDYAGVPQGDGKQAVITEKMVEDLLVDQAEQDKDKAVAAIADGDYAAFDRALQAMAAEGHSVVGLLRIAQAYFYRLRGAAAAIKNGSSQDEAVAKLRPPLFFKAKPAFIRHLRTWPLPRIDRMLGELLYLEAQCKKTGTPELALTQQRLMALMKRAA